MGASAAARIACAAASLIAGILLLSLAGHHPGWTMSLAIFGLAVLAAARPDDALLVFAGVGPVVTILSVLADADNLGIHYPEALALAFLCGAAARRAFDRTPFAVPPRVAWPSLILIAAAVASAVIQAAVLNVEQPDLRAGGTLPIVLATDYLVLQNRVSVALLFAEGLLLFLLVADLCGRNPARREPVVVMMIAGATGAAALNLFRLITAAMRQEHVLATLWNYFLNVRVNVQYSDWNAAASHFVMLLIVALAFASRRRVFLVPAAILGAALWVTGSRTALAAVLITGTGLVLLRRGRSTRQRVLVLGAALAVVVIAGIGGWLWYPSLRNDPIAFSLRTRLVLWRAAVSMMTTNPLFGVGIGGFYELSRSYEPAMLETVIWRPHENAHNYFIQVLAELGIPGFVLFVGVIALSLRELWRRIASDDMAVACGAALAAYLLTCLTGHPLLVPDATYPFWMMLAIGAAPFAMMTAPSSALRWGRMAAIAAVVMFAVTVPVRVRSAVGHAGLQNTALGFSAWQTGPDGQRFRFAGAASTFFVRSSARVIRIPLKAGPQAPPAINVQLFLDGQEADRVQLQAGDDWRAVRLVRFRRGADADYVRIELQVRAGASDGDRPAGAQVLMVGVPKTVEGE